MIQFEKFMTELEELGEANSVLKPFTDVAMHWATKYYCKMDKPKAYVVAMCKFLKRRITALSSPPTVLFSPQPQRTLHVDRKGMGEALYSGCEGDHFAARKLMYYLTHMSAYLVQMRQYRGQTSLGTATVVPRAQVQPAPVTGKSLRPTRFNRGRSVRESGSAPEELSVEAEYRKYTSGEISTNDTDILWFWEVGPFSFKRCYDPLVE
jgi:hypothetical protein